MKILHDEQPFTALGHRNFKPYDAVLGKRESLRQQKAQRRAQKAGKPSVADVIEAAISDAFEPGSTSAATVPCPHCRKKFFTDQSMQQHRKAKHG